MNSYRRRVFHTIKMNIGRILLFEALFRLLALPAYLRLLNRALRFSLQMAGYSYLTAGNIGYFLIKPWTLLCLAGAAAVGMVFLVFEIGGVLTALHGAAYGHRTTIPAMVTGAFRKLAALIRRGNWQLFLLALLDCALIHSFYLYRVLTHVRPLSFVMDEIMGEPWPRLSLVLFLVAGFLLAMASMFVFHGCMIGQKTFRDSFRDSARLLEGHLPGVAMMLFLYNVAITGVTILSYLLCVLAAALILVCGPEDPGAMAVLLAAGDRIETALIVMASIAVVVVNLGAVTAGYFGLGQIPSPSADQLAELSGRRVNYRLAAGVTALGVLIGVAFIYDTVRNGSSLGTDLWTEIPVTAHRGSSRDAPENTMEALETAVEQLADFAEIDVQLSSDGVAVLMHDANLKRVAGLNRRVGAMTWEELQGVDVGSWFSEAFAGASIPSLEQAMEYAKGRINLNIEIKNVGSSLELTDKVVELVQRYGMEEQCVLTSTRLSHLKRVKELDPELRTGYIVSAAYGDYYSNEAVDFISLRSSFVSAGLVESAHELGRGVHVWTVNAKSELERMRMLGVDNVITDYPLLAREILYREKATETLVEYLRLVFR